MTKHTDSLTDRYVAAALVGVHDDQRADVAAELRVSIADAIDARTQDGDADDAAERAVLTELGDPTRLAAEYSGRPLYLIGPAFYPDYHRLLRLLLSIVVPIVALVVGAATVLAGSSVWQVMLSALGTAFSVGVQLAFWVTLVFALIERSGARPRARSSDWSLDDLPAVSNRRIGLGETVGTIAGLSLLIWFLVWQPGYRETLDSVSPSIPVLSPDLSPFWIPFIVAVLLGSIALEIAKYRKGHWTVPLAAVNTVLSLAFAVPAIWLLSTDRLLNPEFVSSVTAGEFASVLDLALVSITWLIAIVSVFDIAEGWWKALRTP